MIKITGNYQGGGKFALLGLSDANVDRLRQGKPIHVFGSELNLSHDIIICWGKTEDDIARELKPIVGRDIDKQVKQ